MGAREIAFVRSRKPYQSYDDFWRLVELSGFRTAWADQADLGSSVVWVWPTMNMEFLGRLVAAPRRRAKVAWWYLERPDANLPDGGDPRAAFRGAVDQALGVLDEVWASDRALAALHPAVRFVPFGSHPGFRECEDLPKIYDIAFMGQRTPRRSVVLAELATRGLAVTPSDIWGVERTRALASSRLMLCVDRTGGMHVAAPIRWAIAAAYGLGILQEELPDPEPLVSGSSIAMAGLGGLAQLACDLIASGKDAEYGARAAKVLTEEVTFARAVAQAGLALA